MSTNIHDLTSQLAELRKQAKSGKAYAKMVKNVLLERFGKKSKSFAKTAGDIGHCPTDSVRDTSSLPAPRARMIIDHVDLFHPIEENYQMAMTCQ